MLLANQSFSEDQQPLLDMEGSEIEQSQAAESADDGSFFVAVRLGAVQSYALSAESIAAQLAADETVVSSGIGFRVGYDFQPWRTWLEYNPAVEASANDVFLDVKSLRLFTDYAIWQTSNQQLALGAYAGRTHIDYRTVEVKGFTWGLHAAYRFNFTQHLYAGVDMQYGINGLKGKGDSSNNIGTIRVEDALHANVNIGFIF